MSALRSASTLLTLRELWSSDWICWSREATVRDSRAMPSKLAWICGPAVSTVFETMSSACFSWPVVDPLGRGGQVAEDADDVVRRLGAV